MTEQAAGQEGKEEEFSWHMAVKDMPHADGFKYPVFEWSYGAKNGFRGGELRAWPLQRTLVFETRRGEGPFVFDNVEGAQAKIDEYGWGAVPHLAEIFQTLQEIKEAISKFPSSQEEIVEAAKKLFSELKKKWQALIPEE